MNVSHAYHNNVHQRSQRPAHMSTNCGRTILNHSLVTCYPRHHNYCLTKFSVYKVTANIVANIVAWLQY